MPLIQVQTTHESEELANELARRLVADRLAACAQVIGPIESHYHWEGKQETAREWLVFSKTDLSKYSALEARIGELHSYENPEIIATPITHASRRYADWVEESLA